MRRYINAFGAPFQELPSLSPQQMYTLQVCYLLVIPPPIGRTVPQGGFPIDLTKLNLLGWADLVQDVAAGLQVLLPRLCLDLGTQVIALLRLLEAATGVGFCHHCCHPRPHCTCTGASQSAPPMSWSQIVQQTQGYGVTSTSRGVTDPSTPMGGMPGYVAPPPGLTPPPDFSIWSIPPPEVPPPPGLPASPLHQEGLTTESHYETAGSGAADSRVTGSYFAGSGAEGYSTTGSYAIGSKVTSSITTGSSDGTTLAPATPILWESAGNPISAGGAAASQTQGERSHL